MSNVIVAKALNSTLGTEDFRGIDQIFEEQLDKLDEILQRNAENIKNAMASIEALTNPVYAYREGDPCIRKVQVAKDGSATIQFAYNGVLRVRKSDDTSISGAKSMIPVSLFGAAIDDTYDVHFTKNTPLVITNNASGDSVIFAGHTEYAPDIEF
jgi:hypothetical protein